ncbi:MAG: tetratricopeptide repeat protein [Acidobacteriota bacterium]
MSKEDEELIKEKVLRGFNLLEGKEIPNVLTIRTYFSPVEAAESEFKEVLQIDSQNYDALVGLGRCCSYDPQKYDYAISVFEQAIKVKPFEATAHYYLGSLFLRMGERKLTEEFFEKAINYFQKADKLDYKPKTPLYNNLGTALFRIEKYEEAIFYFENAAKYAEEEKRWLPSIFFLAAEACEKLSRNLDAIRWYKLSIRPGLGIPGHKKQVNAKIRQLKKIREQKDTKD